MSLNPQFVLLEAAPAGVHGFLYSVDLTRMLTAILLICKRSLYFSSTFTCSSALTNTRTHARKHVHNGMRMRAHKQTRIQGRNGGSTDRLDGAIFSASNAALMLAQMGDLPGATKGMRGWLA